MPLLYEDFPLSKSFSPILDSETTITIIAAYPANTLQAVDMITGKPIANAKVTVDTTEYMTNVQGAAVLDLPDGTYTVKITAPNYLSKTLTITLPMTEPLTVKLIPAWGVALGIVAGATLVVGIAAKIAWRK